MTENKQAAAVTNTVDQLDVDESEFSDLGSSIGSDLTSLSSSIRDHIYENGRRYHSLHAGTYALPNDESEQERLDIMHHAVGLLLEGELHLVRLPEKLDRILDLGTGTGIWAIDIADQHPNALVIGVDLSPIQPSWVPPNCSFEVDDIEKPWLWKEPFDFIHSANLAQGIRDWPTYTKRIYEGLAPGGVVQLHESAMKWYTDDDSIPKGGALESYQKLLNKALDLAGAREICIELESHLIKAGFVDVKVAVKKLPIGTWAKDRRKKELGQWGLAIIEPGLKAYGLGLFTRHLGMSVEDVTELSDRAFKEFCRRDVHVYCSNYFVEGRKPREAENEAN